MHANHLSLALFSYASGRATAAVIEVRIAAPTRETMEQQSVWQDISTAPYDRDLELAVIEGDHLHPLVFACRRTVSGWVKAMTHERVIVHPTHWRPWSVKRD